jgi:hypothetical protein
MSRGSYVGEEVFAKDIGDPFYRSWLAVEPLGDDGKPNTIVWGMGEHG